MTEYKCFNCHKTIAPNYIKKKVRCIYCGYKIIFKTRSQPSTVLAR
ncbi:MAG: DNA-directed RNA polymerase subunit P [Nanoarchaeota archaeon]|nr:DNA-directed RNA polymerase subunit P [Nanoarchaeota archaeon]